MRILRLHVALMAFMLSASAQAEDLMTIFQHALNSDPQLLAQAADKAAVGELADQAMARFLPEVSVSANTSRVRSESSAQTFGGDRDFNSHGYTLSITQPIYRRANSVQSDQAGIAIAGAEARYTIAEQDLIVRVAERYFDFLARQDDVSFSQAEKKANGQQLEQVQLRFDLGLATITDLTESQAGYDLANAELIAAENALANSRERLRETAGLYVDFLSPLMDETPLVVPEPVDSQKWADTALAQNPSLLAARTAKENAQQNIALEKSGHHPSLDLVGEKNYSSQSDTNFGGSSKSHQDSISLRFNLPIYAGGGVSSRVREAGHRLDEAMQNEELERRTVVRQSREAFNGVMSGISRVKALKQALISSEKALYSTEAGYEVGTRTTVDVLNSRRDLYRAKRDYAGSRYDYILSSLRLKQAAGILSPNDLAEINTWLEG